MGIFHKDVCFPRWLQGSIPTGAKKLFFTHHAREQLFEKNSVNLPNEMVVKMTAFDIIEVTTAGHTITKMVARSKGVYADESNLCLAMIPGNEKGTWVVKTAWLNHKDDTHRTLDISRFTK